MVPFALTMGGSSMKKHTLIHAMSLASLATIIVSSLEGSAIAQTPAQIAQSPALQCVGSSGDAAIFVCTEAIKQNSGNWRLYNKRGTAWSEKQDYDKAIADFSEAIRVDPKQVLPYSLRGLAWGEKREWDKAIADYNEAMRVYPIIAGDELNNGIVANLYRFRGTAWLNKRDYDKAISDYNEAILLDPKRSEAAKRNLQRALEANRK
jgi:tetratricopeptide (TPR) repeat protein